MNRIEEVKELIKLHAPEFAEDDTDLTGLAGQINQLYEPQPDQSSRLPIWEKGGEDYIWDLLVGKTIPYEDEHDLFSKISVHYTRMCLERQNAQRDLTSQFFQARIEALIGENTKLRVLLWQGHACDGKYGDDGELQCNRLIAPMDFKRESVNELERKGAIHNLKRQGLAIPEYLFKANPTSEVEE